MVMSGCRRARNGLRPLQRNGHICACGRPPAEGDPFQNMRDTKSIHRQPKTSGTFKPITQAHSGTFGHIRAHSVTLWKFRCSKRQRGGAHSVQPITPCIILIRVHSRGAPRRVGDPSRILCTCVPGPLQLRASHLLLLLLLFPPMDRPADRPATRPTERPTDRRLSLIHISEPTRPY